METTNISELSGNVDTAESLSNLKVRLGAEVRARSTHSASTVMAQMIRSLVQSTLSTSFVKEASLDHTSCPY
jgi:hypothetical protein